MGKINKKLHNLILNNNKFGNLTNVSYIEDMKIKLKPGQKLYFFSDPHYDHKNIVRGVSSWTDGHCTRDFETQEEMNKRIVENINYTVGEDDILFCLGDWSFNGFENIKIFRDQIKCKNIHLILGNHDHHIERNKENCRDLFSSVNQILDLEVKWIDNPAPWDFGRPSSARFTLCHYPICSWKDMNQGVIHIFGHLHSSFAQKVREGKAIDVGLEGNDFYPSELSYIVRIMKHQPIRNITIPQDHHQI